MKMIKSFCGVTVPKNTSQFTYLSSPKSTVAMAGPIRFFLSVQRFYQMLGICPSLQMEQKWNFTWKNIFHLCLFVQIFISSMLICIFRATTMFEYCTNIYVCITESVCIFYYSHQMFKIANIFNFFKHVDELIEKCKLSLNNWSELNLQIFISSIT